MENIKSSKITSDLRQSSAYAKYIQSIGWKTVAVDSVQVFIRPLGIFGAIAKIQRAALPLPWEKIRPVLKKHRVWMTKLEPLNLSGQIRQMGFRPDKWPLLGTKTLRIDLTPPLAVIKKQFKKDARYCLRKVESNKWKIEENNFLEFYSLWKKSAHIKKLWIPPLDHFESLIKEFSTSCFCITINNQAGAFVLIHNKTAYYYYAAALPEAKRKLLPYEIVWQCLQQAKKRGCATWDWEGIFDSRWPNKSWQGFTHFKKSFGGYETLFPGSFTRWL